MDSPAFSSTSRRGSFDSGEDLDTYFASYVPLSNLPTPPPVKGSALNHVSVKPILEDTVLISDLAGTCTNLPYRGVLQKMPLPSVGTSLFDCCYPINCIGGTYESANFLITRTPVGGNISMLNASSGTDTLQSWLVK
jgi:hypothetical protein